MRKETDGKIPPQAVDLEEAVLGALMLETGTKQFISKLKPEMFYLDDHVKLMQVIVDLNRANEPIDILTVTASARKKGILENIGGPFYITTLTNRVASTNNITKHIRLIQECFIKRELIQASSKVIQMAFDDTSDALEVLEYAQKQFSSTAGEIFTMDKLRHISNVADDSLNQLDERIEKAKLNLLPGVKTGLSDLNKAMLGWQKKRLYIIAARPGMGKTALMMKTVVEAARDGNYVSIFSLEMEDISLVDRVLIAISGVEAYRYQKGNISPSERESVVNAKALIDQLPISIDDSGSASVEHIVSVSRAQKTKNALNMIVVDYLQLIDSGDQYKANREAQVAAISRRLKALSKELDVPVLVLCQLNRSAESRADKKPSLGDLRESGAIEQDADLVMFLFRPGYYNLTTDGPENGMELIISKNRFGKQTDVLVLHNESMTDFYDYDPFKTEQWYQK